MAQQTINIGTTANDGTGDPIRSAFDKSNDNFTELYGAGALSIASDILTYTKADGTTSTVDLSPYLDEDARAIASGTIDGAGIVTFTRDDATTFTLDLSSLLDDTNLARITSGSVAGSTLTLTRNDATTIDIDVSSLLDDTTANDATITLSAGSGLTGGGSFTTDQASADTVTFDVNVDDSTIEIATDTVQVKDDGITHAKLEARYTAVQDIATTSGTINLDASSYAAFNLTGNLTTATLNIQNMKTGQVIDILLSGTLSSAVITLADDFTTSSINKVGSNDLDTAATNLIQVLCVDDTDSDAILTWAVAPYTTDTSA